MRWFGIAFLMLLLVACSSTTTPAPQTLTVSAHEFAFAPAALEVTVGQPVRLILKNEGTVEHDFVIEQIPLAAAPIAGESSTAAGHEHDAPPPTTEDDHTADGNQHDHGAADAESQVHVAAAAGGTSTVDFTPTEAGTYEVYCSVPGHKEAGMVAQVVVTEP